MLRFRLKMNSIVESRDRAIRNLATEWQNNFGCFAFDAVLSQNVVSVHECASIGGMTREVERDEIQRPPRKPPDKKESDLKSGSIQLYFISNSTCLRY